MSIDYEINDSFKAFVDASTVHRIAEDTMRTHNKNWWLVTLDF